MKILHIHNYYQQSGGEDQVFSSDRSILADHNHEIFHYTQHNDSIMVLSKPELFIKTLWNQQAYEEIMVLIQKHSPGICHFHNTFPLISPSGYYACGQSQLPVVQRLPNYRLLCPNALFLRNDAVCEDCLGKFFPWPGIYHACYRNSRAASGAVALMLGLHRLMGTWQKQVDVFIALTEFGKQKFIKGGLPEEKIMISPNIVDPDPGQKTVLGDYALFVGRLSQEKGLKTLLQAWLDLSSIPLIIVGDGPMRSTLHQAITNQGLEHVKLLGRKTHKDTLSLMKQARLLVMPSIWYEGFPLTIAEAFASGLPVIGSNLGAMADLIDNDHTGYLFDPGNPQDLARKVLTCWNDQDKLRQMGSAARAEYESNYTREHKYQSLMRIYEKAINNHRRR